MVKPRLETLKGTFNRPTLVITDEGNRCSNIPEKDFDLLMDFYDSLSHPKLKNPNWYFVLDIDSRIYAEWCMGNRNISPYNYQGEGFFDFFRDETHFELIRKGYQWNEKYKSFESLDEKRYNEVRKRILGGLTLRAIELFSDWDGNISPQSRMGEVEGIKNWVYDDKRNIRTSLNNYIIAFDSMNNHC